MATAKKKTATKRPVKYAAKAQSSTHKTASSSNAAWASKSAADWQQGASDWAKQSAKLYQMPFAQGDMGAAAQQASEQMKSATESMVKMSNDMMQQLFAQAQQGKPSAAAAQAFNPASFFKQLPQMPQFDMESAQAKMAAFARESSEQLARASQGSSRASAEAVELARENIEAATEVCNVAVAVTKELAAELISYANKQFAQNVELSKQVLGCRTLNDMFDLSTRMMKSNLDAFFSESVKISEMLFQCATDVSEPLNERVSETTERLSKVMAA